VADVFGAAQIGHGVGNGVISEAQEGSELFLVEFLHADLHVVLKDEVEEDLLLGRESGVDVNPGMASRL
jgi:hypothetical protein